VSVVAYGRDGSLAALQASPTVPEGFGGANSVADIRLGPGARFLYVGNRGHDSIAVFAVDAGTGLLAAVGHEPSLGRTPRGCAIDPSGRFLFVANQDSDSIVGFRLDPQTGRPRPTGQALEVPSPTCVLPVVL
jgi:6-phosphogluconolactonase (cycloisomerase 2 family)